MSSNGHAKLFVLDTNVLLHNPNALFMFKSNEVIIAIDVIEELDKVKAGTDDLGRNARTAIRRLDGLRIKGNLTQGVELDRTGAHLRVILEEDRQLGTALTTKTPDNRLTCSA